MKLTCKNGPFLRLRSGKSASGHIVLSKPQRQDEYVSCIAQRRGRDYNKPLQGDVMEWEDAKGNPMPQLLQGDCCSNSNV